MSEFKFACPVCGQHITCDSGSAGSQMDCPTCFRKLVVPQAASAGATHLVLTAAEVQSRPIPVPGGSAAAPVVKPQKYSWWFIGLGVLFIVAGVTAAVLLVIKKKQAIPPIVPVEVTAVTNARPSLGNLKSATDATNWTLNLADVKIPEAPVSGQLRGLNFQLERAVINGGKLDLRQGGKWPPDLGLSIHLFAKRAQDLAGQTVVLEATRTNAPRVILRWKDEADKAVTKDFHQGYLARLEFGKVTGNRLEGKIYLALPDDEQSYAAGTFNAEIRKPNPKN